jgi:hypothetical protein
MAAECPGLYDPVVSSRVEVYSLVAISYSGALPRRMLVSAACSARRLQFRSPEVSDFWRLPLKTPTPPTTSGLLSEARALRR